MRPENHLIITTNTVSSQQEHMAYLEEQREIFDENAKRKSAEDAARIAGSYAARDAKPVLIDKTNWNDFGNCDGVDPDLFFPTQGESTKAAKEICRGCVVRMECLEYALTNGEKFGIWGGMSERERRRIRRQRILVRNEDGRSFRWEEPSA